MSETIPPIRTEPPKPKPVPADASKPVEDPKGKIPTEKLKIKKVEANQPRQRKTPVVQLPKPDAKSSPSPFWLQLKNFGRDNLVKATLALLVIGGIAAFLLLRETRLQAAIEPGSFQLQPEVCIVTDFTERIAMIKKGLEARLEPIRQELSEAENSLASAQADFAARSQSKKLLADTIDQDEQKMGQVINETRGKLDTLWDDEFKKLDDEQQKAQADLNNKIKEKAKALNLTLTLQSGLDAPEVMVNAFRLALYGTPKEVDVNAQRQCVEALLQEWKQAEFKIAEKRAALRGQVQKVREPLGGQIEEIQKRMARMREEIAHADENIKMIQEEINRFEERVSELKKQMQDTIQPFYEDILRAPTDYVRFTYPIQNNAVDVREIEKNHEFKPGKYRLLIRSMRDGDEYWCLQDFEITAYKTTKVRISPDQFVLVRSFLDGAASN